MKIHKDIIRAIFGIESKEDKPSEVHWKDKPHNVEKATVQIVMKDGTTHTVTRTGALFEGLHYGRPMIFFGSGYLKDHLDACKGLLKVDGGLRIPVCNMLHITPVEIEPYFRTCREEHNNE